MNRFLSLFFVFMFFAHSFASASSIFSDKKSRNAVTADKIYFCTRNMEFYYSSFSSPSSVSSESGGTCSSSDQGSSTCSASTWDASFSMGNKRDDVDKKKSLVVSSDISDDSTWFNYFKHCFFMHGRTINEGSSTKKISLNVVDTIGYGSVGYIANDGAVGGENPEAMATSTIACVPVVIEEDLRGKTTTNYDGSISPMRIRHVWAQIVDLMEGHTTEKTGNKYNIFSNNCCSVAYRTIVNVLGEDKARELIKPKSFNMAGLGIEWGDWIAIPYGFGMSTIRYIKNTAHDTVIAAWQLSTTSSKSPYDVVDYSKIKVEL